MFDPDDGTLMLPECLGSIDTLTNRVNFESTSSNVGRSLKLLRQDVRIKAKQIIVIVQNDLETKIAEKYCEDNNKTTFKDVPLVKANVFDYYHPGLEAVKNLENYDSKDPSKYEGSNIGNKELLKKYLEAN